jgi:hypothetical protein
VIKIDGIGKTTATAGKAVSRKSGDTRAFAALLAGQADAPVEGGETESIGGINALLTLQEIDPNAERQARRQKTLAYAEDLVKQLEAVRDAMLTGQLPLGTLQRLQQLVINRRSMLSGDKTGDDPNLMELLDEIDLRARVEMAKLEYALGQLDNPA